MPFIKSDCFELQAKLHQSFLRFIAHIGQSWPKIESICWKLTSSAPPGFYPRMHVTSHPCARLEQVALTVPLVAIPIMAKFLDLQVTVFAAAIKDTKVQTVASLLIFAITNRLQRLMLSISLHPRNRILI